MTPARPVGDQCARQPSGQTNPDGLSSFALLPVCLLSGFSPRRRQRARCRWLPANPTQTNLVTFRSRPSRVQAAPLPGTRGPLESGGERGPGRGVGSAPGAPQAQRWLRSAE